MWRINDKVYMGRAASPTAEATFVTNEIPYFSGKRKRPHKHVALKRYRGDSAALDQLILENARVAATKDHRGRFHAEELGALLNIRVDQIRHSLHRLNLKGLVSQAVKADPPHDTNRSYWGGNAMGWSANEYRLLK